VAKFSRSAVEPLLPVTLPKGEIRYAPGIKAGRWIFATGHKGTADYVNGMSPDVLRPGLPFWDSSKHRRESDRIFVNLGTVLKAGGSDVRSIARVDQYYTDYRAVEPYHAARRAALQGHIPPSTSILQQRFLLAGQEIEVQMIAVVPAKGMQVRHVSAKGHQIHASSGYSLALTAGDFVFVAGRLADALSVGDGLAPAASLPAGHLWKGTPVKLETDFIVEQKIEPALKAAGSSLADVVKCQVYLRDPADFAPFNEALAEALSEASAGDEPHPDVHAGAGDRERARGNQHDRAAQRRQDPRANRERRSHACMGRITARRCAPAISCSFPECSP